MSESIPLHIEGNPTVPLSTPVINQIIEAISPTATVTKAGKVATITVTDKNGTTTETVSDGDDGYTPVKNVDYFDGEDGHSPVVTASKAGKVTTISVDGEPIATINDGNNGQDGQDGVSPTVSVETISGGHEVTITDGTGDHSFNVYDGADGADGSDGVDGVDGYSPTATVSKSGKTATISITDKDGTTTATVSDGEDADPTDLIDDTAGSGDTGKVWSADKSASEKSSTMSAINAKYTKPETGIPASDLASGVIPSVPVQDVQVNGTSILSQGVANIPVAGENTIGAVKVAYGYQGLYVHSTTNQLIVSKASDSDIKTGTNQMKPIVPDNQDKSVFYALAKLAGADMASSSNPVGTFTESAKKAICAMLGVRYDEPYRKINEVTITEDTVTVTISTDTNGDAFSLKDAIIFFENVVGSSASHGLVYVNDSTIQNDGAFLTIPSLYSTTVTNKYATLNINGGRFFGQAAEGNVTSNYTNVRIDSNRNSCGYVECSAMTKFKVLSLNGHSLSSGKITIYGR